MLRSKEDKAAKTAASSNKTDKTTADESDQTNSDVDVQEIKIDTGNPPVGANCPNQLVLLAG